jgi:hypothetical protein
MAIGVQDVFDQVESHALASGWFERVNTHEPKRNPGNGLTAAVWIQRVAPVPAGSGLAATTGRLELRTRIYSNMLQEPQDAIDPNILVAVDDLLDRYSGDFTLGGRVRNVDLLGAHGEGLGAIAGYVNIDGAMHRVMDIVLPLIINDIWSQSE